MNLLLDQNVHAVTAKFLRSMGHDVLTARECGLSEASDEDILAASVKAQRILLTRDRDFGGLVYAGRSHCGVLYVRGSPAADWAIHVELRAVLDTYSSDQLQQAFVAIEPGRHRFRKLPPRPR
jgi:predicted nuclease of predicted toxin-antitoxin system